MKTITPDIRHGRPAGVILVGGLLLLAYWLLEFVDHLIASRGVTSELLLRSHAEEYWFRMAVSLLLCGFTFYVWLIVRQRDRLEAALELAVQQAQDEQTKSAAIIAAIADGVSIQDVNFRVRYQNTVHQHLSGGDRRGELCYQAYAALTEVCPACPVADALVDGQVHRLVKNGPGNGIEFIELTASPILNARGELVGCLEIVRDISERKLTEEALRQQVLFAQRLIDTIPSPVFYKDTKGVFLGCNAAFEACINLPREQVVGRTLFDLMPREVAAMYAEKDDELFARPGTQIYETYLQCAATCEQHEVIFYKATFTDQLGEIAGLVGVVIDISERTAAERAITALNNDLSLQAEALTAANRELEAYNYSFTHDLRNNLTRISSASQILIEIMGEKMDEDGLSLLNGVITASEQILELSEAMQMLFSVTRREVMRETVNLSEVASIVALGLKLGDPSREVSVTIQPELIAEADPRLLRILLENLLGNAWKYTAKRQQAQIEVGGVPTENGIAFFVRDNGAGFPAGQEHRLFAPFTRLHGADEFPGSGIGLATVQRIVQRHGGTIRGEGESGQGAVFWFTLPPTVSDDEQHAPGGDQG